MRSDRPPDLPAAGRRPAQPRLDAAGATSSSVVLSVSSQVVRGSVGNRAMVFALERLGFSVHALPSVLLTRHPGHGPAHRTVIGDDDFAALLEALGQADIAQSIAGIASGYLASPGQAEALSETVKRIKSVRPEAVYLCDPVIGDEGRLYVAEPIASAIRDRLMPLADIATPNAFECAWLARRGASGDLARLAACARFLPPSIVLVTSAPSMMRGQIGNLLVAGETTLLYEHRAIDTRVKGTGDLLAALILGRRLLGNDWPRAVELAVASVVEVLAGTTRSGANELLLGRLQGALIDPQAQVAIRTLGGAA